MADYGGVERVEIAGTPQQCFDVVCDAPNMPNWHETTGSAEVLERDTEGRPSLVRAGIEALVIETEVDLRFTYTEPHRVDINLEAGPFERLTAAWIFEDLGQSRTMAHYETKFDPAPALSAQVVGSMAEDLNEMLVWQPPEGLKIQVEA